MSNFAFQLHIFKDPIFPAEVPAMTADERVEFVKGLLNETIFSSMHIQELDKKKGDLGRIFLPQGAGQLMVASQQFRENIGCLWEFTREVAQNAHTGSATKIVYPTFSTARLCSILDWDMACDVVATHKKRQVILAPH